MSVLGEMKIRPSVSYRYQLEFRAFCDRYGQVPGTSAEIFRQYVQEARVSYATHKISIAKFRRLRRAVDLMEQCYHDGTAIWRRLPAVSSTEPSAPGIRDFVGDFQTHLRVAGRSASTIQGYSGIAASFQRYLVKCGRTEWSQISKAYVRDFIPYMATRYQPTSMGPVLTGLRSFLAFLAQQAAIVDTLQDALPHRPAHKTLVIPPITNEEEQRLLAAIDRSTAIGKRDWAMLVLALRLGLRTVDIVHLELSNIDWRKNTLSLTQHKTGRPLVLPLISSVGNALADYISSGRPDSGSHRVFLRHTPPHQGFSDAWSCSERVKHYMQAAGIRQEPGTRGGAHWLRHALATRLLEAATPVTVIASVLGHGRPDSTQVYLFTDLESLRRCALSLAGIECGEEA